MPLRSRFAAVFSLTAFAAAGNAQVQTWHDVGQIGGPLIAAAGIASSLIQEGDKGHAARTFDGILVAGGISELLGATVRERRPYGTALDSFPSTHASISFAAAAAQSYYHPKQAPLWYGAATVVAVARVAGHDHFVQDVVAGAALGFGSGYLSVTSKRGWIVAPLVEKGHTGVMFSFTLG